MKSLCLFILLLVFFACRKTSLITSPDAQVTITSDTLKFDTVFTTTGSVTQSFKIINENNGRLRISDITLSGGNNSAFRINVDGSPGPQVSNLEIEANDSLYVFVSVSINPNANNLPFVIRDSIRISFNGNERLVQLEAWGQNAHFFRNKKVTANETWINDLPYVILGSLIVDTPSILTIQKGCRIYVHADAPLIIDGTLLVNGEKDTLDRVLFTGDRLDEPYRDFPASWPGIYFRGSSKDNVITHAIIKNAYQAIALIDPPPNSNDKLTLNETIIDNAYDAGIIALNSSLNARNCLVSNCGKNIVLVKGGNYRLNHCTVATYSNSFLLHREPVLLVSNFITVNNTPIAAPLTALFMNCIFWGDNGTVADEVVVARTGSLPFDVDFHYVLWKLQNYPSNVDTLQVLNNRDPEFDSINVSRGFYNFHLKPGSPAVNYGLNTGVTLDLDGRNRPIGPRPDLGCYEN